MASKQALTCRTVSIQRSLLLRTPMQAGIGWLAFHAPCPCARRFCHDVHMYAVADDCMLCKLGTHS
jgi:hypothetical protein